MLGKQTKIILAVRVVMLITCIIGVGGLVWATTKEHAISTDGLGIASDTLGAIAVSKPLLSLSIKKHSSNIQIQLGISGLWSLIAFFVTILFNDPIHPGVYIGLDVTLCALTLAVGIAIPSSYVSDVGDITCNNYSFCNETEDRTVIFRIVATAFCLFNA